MVIIFEPGIAQGLKVESGIPQVLISEAGITLLFLYLRLEFLTGLSFSSWNSSWVQVFGIPHGGTPQEHVSSTGGVRILNGITDTSNFSAHC